MPEFDFSGAILAGGRSSRMGRDKAFLSIDGITLIERQAAHLRALGVDDLLISGRPGTVYPVPDARVVYDRIPDAGPLAGLAAVLAAARHPWVLVLAVDLPRLTPSYLHKLIAAGAGRMGAVPRNAHGYEPLVALYPRALLPELEAALTARRFGLQPLLTRAESAGLLRALPIAENETGEFTNWNTPAL